MDRRIFLRNTAIGMGTMANIGFNGLKAEELNANPPTEPGASAKATWGDGIGRPVRVASIGFKGGCVPLEKMASLVDEEGARGTDVIVLPELCSRPGQCKRGAAARPDRNRDERFGKKAQNLHCLSD